MGDELRSKATLLREFGAQEYAGDCLPDSQIPDYLPASYKIDIQLSEDKGVVNLEGLANASTERLGEQISHNISYDEGSLHSVLNLKLQPSSRLLDIYFLLEEIANNIRSNEEYSRLLDEREGAIKGVLYADYLGGLKKQGLVFRGAVGEFLKKGYQHCEVKYKVGKDEILSGSRVRDTSHARSGLFYALNQRFPSTHGKVYRNGDTGLSMPDIADIFGMNHATVIIALNRIRQKVPNSSVEDKNLVRLLVDEGFNALHN